MMRHLLIALAAAAVVGTSIIPDEAFARRVGAVGVRGGAVGYRGVGVAGRGYGYRPIQGRPIARAAVRGAAYRGVARRGAYWGAAAIGAGAVGAGYYYRNGYNNCYRDAYGQLICPNQYPYQY